MHIPSPFRMQAVKLHDQAVIRYLQHKDGLLNLKSELQELGKPIVKTTILPTGVVAVTRSTGSVTPFGLLLALMIFYTQTIYFTELPLSSWFRNCHVLETTYIRKMSYSHMLHPGQTPSDTRVGVLVTTTNLNLVKPGKLV